MTTICCVCQKTKNRGRWEHKQPACSKKLSHGYCPACFRRLMKKIRERAAGSALQDNTMAV